MNTKIHFAMVLTLLLSVGDAEATTIGVGGVTTTVAPGAASALQCVLSSLAASGYPVRFLGGYARGGHVRGSLHYTGMALDVNQTSRNRTAPPMPGNEIQLAEACGAISGAGWRGNPDSGHFQVGGWSGARNFSRHRYRRGQRRHGR